MTWNRPQWRCLHGVALFAASTLLASSATAEYNLAPRSAEGRLDRVAVEIEVGGHLLKPQNPDDRSSATDKTPMSVQGELEYDERRLGATRSARYYRRAEATITTGSRAKSPTLPEGRRLIVADAAGDRVVLFTPRGALTRDQLDLIDVIGATLRADDLMPREPVGDGGEWAVDAGTMGRLLGLDAVTDCEVAGVVDDGNAKYARFQLAGSVRGRLDGADTQIDLRAIGLFSLGERRLTQLNLAIREERQVGPATPGFEGVAKARIKIQPLDPAADTPPELADDRVADLDAAEAATLLAAEAGRQGFRVRHDRRWFGAGEDRRSLALRRVEGTELTADATFTVAPIAKGSATPSPEEFERLVRRSLGDALGTLVSSEQWTNPAGCRCLGILAQGDSSDGGVEWRYYQATPADGGVAVSLATTLRPTATKETADAARGLIDSLEVVPAERTAKRKSRRRR